MADQTTTPVMGEPASVAPAPVSAPTPPKKKKKKKLVKNIIIAVVVLAVAAAVAFLVWKFAFAETEVKGEILTDFAYRSSISSMVQGSGNARATKSATITLAAAGTVQEVFVTDGQMINEGDPLFVINSSDAQKALDDAKTRVEDLQKDLTARHKSLGDLQTELGKLNKELSEIYTEQSQSDSDRYIKVPFAGQLRECVNLTLGSDQAKDTKIAVLVDDSKFRLSLYFSYAYEGKIKVGDTAQVSVTSSMTTLTGKVEEVNMVRRATAEGSVLFEAVIVLDNPGALQADASATATLTQADGTAIYPYEAGKLAYYRTADILTETTGKVLKTDLLNYSDVAEGQVVAVLDKEDFSEKLESKDLQIEGKKSEIKSAQESITTANITIEEAVKKVEEAQKALDDFSAVAPMTGTVVSCTLLPGETVESGRVAVTIADNSMMKVDINIDERNVQYIKAGMNIDLTDWNGNTYMGTVESVSIQGKNENGVTTYPAVVTVDNASGTLMSNMYLDYSFAASQSLDCIVIPIQCVKYISDDTGTTSTAVFLKAETKPENALELTPEMAKDLPEGFYAVPVTIGLSDTTNVEIVEGLEDGAEVFTNFLKENSNSY